MRVYPPLWSLLEACEGRVADLEARLRARSEAELVGLAADAFTIQGVFRERFPDTDFFDAREAELDRR